MIGEVSKRTGSVRVRVMSEHTHVLMQSFREGEEGARKVTEGSYDR